jgi:CRISPR-associated endoribonuclease Cas6
MLLKLTLTATEIPVIFRNRISDFIKSAAENGYRRSSYEITEGSYKFFTFNLAFPRDKIAKERICFDNSYIVEDSVFKIPEGKFATLYVSSPFSDFLNAVKTGFDLKKELDFSQEGQMLVGGKKLLFVVENSRILNSPYQISENVIQLHTHSPILLESQNTKKPIIPPVDTSENTHTVSVKEYSDRLAEISSMRIYGMTGKYPLEPISFSPVNMKKTVVKHTLEKFREKTGKPLMMLTGITGTFQISGAPSDLSLLIESGIGLRTTQGFGMSGPAKI